MYNILYMRHFFQPFGKHLQKAERNVKETLSQVSDCCEGSAL